MQGNTNADFITMGDEQFARTLICSAISINRIYPESTLYLYDWGLQSDTRRELQDIDNVCLVNWKARSEYRTKLLQKIRLFFESSIDSSKVTKYVFSRLPGFEFAALEKQKDYYMRQKPLCLLDCIDRTNKPLIFLDGDAILIRPIDEIFEMPFDIGVTLRSKIEAKRMSKIHDSEIKTDWTSEGNLSMLLNAGVIFLNTSSEKSRKFINLWLRYIENMDIFGLREQTALSKLIYNSNKDIFKRYYSEGRISLDSGELITKVLPCEKYNYYWIKKGFDPNRNKILHFKGGMGGDNVMREVIESIEDPNATDMGQVVEPECF